jgi:hypothetical protein
LSESKHTLYFLNAGGTVFALDHQVGAIGLDMIEGMAFEEENPFG